VDDIVQMPVTQYDVIRILPFGGGIKKIDMTGSLLIRILEAGLKNKDTGGFLHYNENLRFDAASRKWVLDSTVIDPAKTYRVALTDFLLTGGEANLDFLTTDNKEITKVYEQTDPLTTDIRKAIISYATKQKL
jgi:2',3'-cyclic-nucleotide 2'-phosphodiesterase (5'-nucleotidase family)